MGREDYRWLCTNVHAICSTHFPYIVLESLRLHTYLVFDSIHPHMEGLCTCTGRVEDCNRVFLPPEFSDDEQSSIPKKDLRTYLMLVCSHNGFRIPDTLSCWWLALDDAEEEGRVQVFRDWSIMDEMTDWTEEPWLGRGFVGNRRQQDWRSQCDGQVKVPMYIISICFNLSRPKSSINWEILFRIDPWRNCIVHFMKRITFFPRTIYML